MVLLKGCWHIAMLDSIVYRFAWDGLEVVAPPTRVVAKGDIVHPWNRVCGLKFFASGMEDISPPVSVACTTP